MHRASEQETIMGPT